MLLKYKHNLLAFRRIPGAPFNVETIRRLSIPNRAVIYAKGVYENGDKVIFSLGLSGLTSRSYNSGNFTVSGFACYQRRNSRSWPFIFEGYFFFDYNGALSFLQKATVLNASA